VTQRVIRHEFKQPLSELKKAEKKDKSDPKEKEKIDKKDEDMFAHGMLPCFQPLPESQPVLPCLLRRLLQVLHNLFTLSL
jgi:hypothetical protein